MYTLFYAGRMHGVITLFGNHPTTWSASAQAWSLQSFIARNEPPPFLHHTLLYVHRNSSPSLIPSPPYFRLALYRRREMIQRILSELSGE